MDHCDGEVRESGGDRQYESKPNDLIQRFHSMRFLDSMKAPISRYIHSLISQFSAETPNLTLEEICYQA